MDMFRIREMISALTMMFLPKTFLLDLFFQDVEVSGTEYVDIDIVKGGRTLAPFVSPNLPGTNIAGPSKEMKTIKPPYLKPKIPTTAGDLLNRGDGDTVYPSGSPAMRAQEKLGKDLVTLIGSITRREEWMAANALNTGVITVVGEGINATIDFQMSASHQVTLTGTNLFTDAASDPSALFEDWIELISKDSGLVPDACVMGINVYKAFSGNTKVKAELDNRRIETGVLGFTKLPNGAIYRGTFKGIAIFTYAEYYDDNGVLTPMVPVDKIFLGCTQARTARLYGAIQDLKAVAELGGSTVAVQHFPKSWEEEDPSVRWLMVQSAPVVAPLQVDAFMSIKAV